MNSAEYKYMLTERLRMRKDAECDLWLLLQAVYDSNIRRKYTVKNLGLQKSAIKRPIFSLLIIMTFCEFYQELGIFTQTTP